MATATLVMGGCRSGKSGHAQALAEQAGEKRLFIATCVPCDEEMEQRVRRHRRLRGPGWHTIESPIRLGQVISREQDRFDVMLVDCLTLWTTNLLAGVNGQAAEPVDVHLGHLIRAIENAPCDLVLVSNEVGAGIVPENALARRFRDVAGEINQQVAAAVDTVIWVMAGIPVKIKG